MATEEPRQAQLDVTKPGATWRFFWRVLGAAVLGAIVFGWTGGALEAARDALSDRDRRTPPELDLQQSSR